VLVCFRLIPLHDRLCLYLESTDEMQCRFAVKNDEKEGNQKLEFVQQFGYLEYKARYCKKRGQQTRYGFFRVAFQPRSRIIYPFQRAGPMGQPIDTRHLLMHGGSSVGGVEGHDETDTLTLTAGEFNVGNVHRLEMTCRLYQSFRGVFPCRLVEFEGGES